MKPSGCFGATKSPAACRVGVEGCEGQQSSALRPFTLDSFTCAGDLLCALCPLSHAGCPQEVPGGAQEQRGESGEVPGRAEEAAQEEPGQQEPVQVRREGDAGESFFFFFFMHSSELHLIIKTDARETGLLAWLHGR